jgi:hypothetical protein
VRTDEIKNDLILDEPFSLTSQFIEVLERPSIGYDFFKQFSARCKEPLKTVPDHPFAPTTPLKVGVLMRTRLKSVV